MKHKLLEIGKDLLIALLVLAIVVLIILALPSKTITQTPWLAAVLRPVAPLLGLTEADLTYTEPAEPVSNAAQPLTISIYNTAGRSTFQYNFSQLDAAYETLGGALGEAMDTAGTPEESTRAKFFAALGQAGVLFRYDAQLPAEVLASWLDAQWDEQDLAASWFLLSVQQDMVRLYLLGDSCYVQDTGLDAADFSALLDEYRPDGSFFAFEDATGLYSRVDSSSLISPDAAVYAAKAANPCDTRYTQSLATSLGFNPYGDASYTDSAGNTIFTETDRSLQISAAGQIALENESNQDARFRVGSDDADARIEAARALLSTMLDGAGGDARLYLSDFTQTSEGAECSFDYVVNGVPVRQRAGAAGTVTITGRTITKASLTARSYSLSTEQVALLPAAQVAAIVPDGTTLSVFYADAGGDSLQAGWPND